MELDVVLDPQQIEGKPPRRIDSPLNEKLFELVPVVYGAVLSYALYVLAQIIILFISKVLDDNIKPETVYLLIDELANKVLVFMAVILFMMKDIGEIVKISKDYPYTRSSRFMMEIIIACFYLISFALIEKNSYFAIISFCAAVIVGGLSQNKFKGEYLNFISKIDRLAQTHRFLHYLGGGLILLEAAVFIKKGYSFYLQWPSTICFIATFLCWVAIYDFWILKEHGPSARHYLVNIVPGRLLMKFYNRHYISNKNGEQNG